MEISGSGGNVTIPLVLQPLVGDGGVQLGLCLVQWPAAAGVEQLEVGQHAPDIFAHRIRQLRTIAHGGQEELQRHKRFHAVGGCHRLGAGVAEPAHHQAVDFLAAPGTDLQRPQVVIEEPAGNAVDVPRMPVGVQPGGGHQRSGAVRNLIPGIAGHLLVQADGVQAFFHIMRPIRVQRCEKHVVGVSARGVRLTVLRLVGAGLHYVKAEGLVVEVVVEGFGHAAHRVRRGGEAAADSGIMPEEHLLHGAAQRVGVKQVPQLALDGAGRVHIDLRLLGEKGGPGAGQPGGVPAGEPLAQGEDGPGDQLVAVRADVCPKDGVAVFIPAEDAVALVQQGLAEAFVQRMQGRHRQCGMIRHAVNVWEVAFVLHWITSICNASAGDRISVNGELGNVKLPLVMLLLYAPG